MAISKRIVAFGLMLAVLTVGVFHMSSNGSEQLTAEPQCVDRATMVARGKSWVDKNVPYSGTSYYEGYRQDCSGFVSMCWQLSTSMTTANMMNVANNITKGELLPGDAILCHQGDAPGQTHHVVLFVGWTDSSKTHFTGYEEANPSKGTVSEVIPYPFWDTQDCYHPIRYKSVC